MATMDEEHRKARLRKALLRRHEEQMRLDRLMDEVGRCKRRIAELSEAIVDMRIAQAESSKHNTAAGATRKDRYGA